ncbi:MULTISPECIES: FAD-binding oxidoreductase [Microbacterium]|uniref:FAD-binding oxidoreductase n=1 Tax=Microbacterium TaxID=33882 RepID=UPI0025FCC4B5|nr:MULTISPECIES: FAD-binding oxidoreductase [unclassified Microbacterium]
MTVGAWLAASVLEVRPAGFGARTLVLDVPEWPGNLPGQHLDLRLTAEDGYQAVRSYSIASFGSGTAVELGVDEVEDGEVSPYLVEDVRAGDQMEAKGPLGQYFVWDATDPSPVQLIAGGSGIVPLIAMVRAHVAADASASMRLVYSVKDADRAMYRDELLALDAPRISATWAYTRAAPDDWSGTVGRLSAPALADALHPASVDPVSFVCGPTPFVEFVAGALVSLGYRAERIRTERFGGGS